MPLNKIAEKVETLEETSEKIEQKVDDLKESSKKINDALQENSNVLHESVGVVGVYKDIIKSNRRTNIILIILIIVLTVTLIHNEKEFTAYRENSINKEEIIEILKDSTYNGD